MYRNFPKGDLSVIKDQEFRLIIYQAYRLFKMKKLILVGAGGHARSLIDLVESNGDFKIIGLIGILMKLENNLRIWGIRWWFNFKISQTRLAMHH